MSGIFLPSMIEVEFGKYYKICAELLFREGFNSFHVDFGDKKLIGRELECWDKVGYLKSLGSEMKLTAHIMSVSGSHKLSVERLANRCLEEGFEIIYIHSRSFKDFYDFLKFKEKTFQNAHHIFGVVSEISNKKNYDLIDFVSENSIKNLLQMGVPIGKGGQTFNWAAADRIDDFKKDCKSLSNIEIDGGLTFDVIKKLDKQKIDRYAGWSIIYDSNPSEVINMANGINIII